MRRCNSNKYLAIASFSALIYLGIGRFVQIPNIVEGFCVGISIAFYLIGAYTLNYDINKVRDFKKKLIGKFIKLA